ncbi:hypothetical protein DSO57_1035599 [Entomophthora muscae]|uniref:Uncharacterized protein n=1 Tax=Entomophthora muscae TaxID=34485 RepID=A0ACC2TXD3_9FUNG|nr:hypothetical protein DSO57_1035599 [Entomophthora muscae]
MRHVNLDQKAEQTSNTPIRPRLERERDPKTLIRQDAPIVLHLAIITTMMQAINVMVDSIMPGIVRPSKKAQKAGKPVSKLTELTDLNQMVD